MALLLAQAAPAVPPDVVVNALHRMRLSVSIHDRRLTDCAVRVSSGLARVDTVACDATRTCVDRGITLRGPLAACVHDMIGADLQRRAARATGDR